MTQKIALILAFWTAAAAAATAGENLALGKKYTMSPAPNYSHCTDDGDTTQLTDGVTTDQYFWTQPGTVGWQQVPWVDVTVDLEKVEPIDSVAFTSAAGVAGVSWPILVSLFVSKDGGEWYALGDLMSHDAKRNGPFDATKYNRRKISADSLATKARFVKLFFRPTGSFVFLDEIEIGRGDDSALERPVTGKKTKSIVDATEKTLFKSQLMQRYVADKDAITALIENRRKTSNDASLNEKLGALTATLAAIAPDERFLDSVDPKTFRTIFPFDTGHAALFARQAEYWRLANRPAPLIVERVEPFDFVRPVTELPNGSASVETPLTMACNETASAAFMLYNTTENPADVTISLDGDFAAASGNVRCYDVPWTDTTQRLPVAAALTNATTAGDSRWSVAVLPGLPKQVWFDVDSTSIPVGTFQGAVRFDAAGFPTVHAPMTLKIADVRLPETESLTLGGWDYTSEGGQYNVNAKNLNSFIATMRAFGVNAPWATSGIMFAGVRCEKIDGAFDVSFDTGAMDEWLALWPDAKEYYIFVSAPTELCGVKYDSDDFAGAAGAWAKKWGAYFTAKNIAPDRVFLLVRDEPGLDHEKNLAPLTAWSKAIKAGEPRFQIWEDPIYAPPTKMPGELPAVCDVLCPNRPQWLQDRENFETVYRKIRDEGKRLDFYSCSGPVRLLDPYNYFRLQAWHIFAERGKTSFFWAMGDGAGVSSWNEYRLIRNGYCPMFIDPNDAQVTPGKQLAAMRQSAYDFKLLTLLRQFAAEHPDTERGKRAQKLLDEGVPAVLWAEGNEKLMWYDDKDRTCADALRREILDVLSK